MKINGHSPDSSIQEVATNATEAARSRSTSSADKSGKSSKADTVALSPEAQLVAKSIKAASAGPAVRQDKVEQARQKLALGQIGQDAHQLAGKIIDHLIED